MKKFTKIIIAAVFLCVTAVSGMAAEGIKNKNAIGIYFLGASQTIGGIQYERRFTDLFSTKFNTYIYYSGEDYVTEPLNYNLDVEFDFTVYESEWNQNNGSRLFLYGLIGHTGTLTRTYDYETEIAGPLSYAPNAIVSAGFGFDFVFFNHLSVPLQFGFMGNFPFQTSAGFCGGAGIRYSW